VRAGVEAFPLVIAAGGDGTVGAAADVVAGTTAVLGIIPLGTSNDVARSLGIPPDPVEAAQALADGEVISVDAGELEIGEAPRRTFMNAATVGVNVAFAELATTSRMRDRFGALTYPVAAASAVRRHVPFTCTLEYNGRIETLELIHLSVSNAPVFGGVLGIRVPGASITDGRLDVVAIERRSIARLVLAFAFAFMGQDRPVHGVHAVRVEAITVSGNDTDDVAVDGEVVGRLPVGFRVRARGIRVVTPRPA
jgi:YegS/Rv2252/BmrU family lipid kinase